MNNHSYHPNSENEDPFRFDNSKVYTSYEIKRQPLSQRNGNEPPRDSSLDRINKKNSKQQSQKPVYRQSVLDIENEFFKPDSTKTTKPAKIEKTPSQSDRYEKQPSFRSERQKEFQRLGVLTPSPSPPKFKENEFSNIFETNYQDNSHNSRTYPSRYPEPTRFSYQPEEINFHSQTERGRPSFPPRENLTQVPFRQFNNGSQQPYKRTNMFRSQTPTGVKRPPKSSAGDWTCTGCKNINFARRINCNICQMPKPYFEILKTPISQVGPQGLFKDSDWQCFNCRNINFQKRENCNICNEPKPEEYVQRDFQMMKQRQKGPKKPQKGGSKLQSKQNITKKFNYGKGLYENNSLIDNYLGISKTGRLATQGKSPNFQQKKYSYSNNSGNGSNGVPFNQRPVQRERSRSFMRK